MTAPRSSFETRISSASSSGPRDPSGTDKASHNAPDGRRGRMPANIEEGIGMVDTTPGVQMGERFVPREEITRRAALLAGGLHKAGVGAGDAVAIIVRNDTAHIEATIAAGRVGAYPVPVNWHWKADEVEYLLNDCGARFLVIHSDLLAGPGIRDAIPDGVEVLSVATPAEILEAYRLPAEIGKPAAGDTDYYAWLDEQQSLDEQLAAAPSSMIYTSGTTGRPKGVQRRPPTPEETALGTQALVAAFGLQPGVRTIIPAPMYHSAPNAYSAVSFALGGFVVLMPRFDPVEFLELIERHQITHVQVVPTMFVRLLQLPEEVRNRYDISSLEFVVHAAAPCPEDIKRRMIEWFGPVIWEYYGCTESGAVVLCGSEDWLAHPGTVGKPFLSAEVKIVDPDGNELGPWESGDVYVRMHGGGDFTYRNDDDKRRRAS